MNTSRRFAFATHILTLLTVAADTPLTSEYMARSVNTHPVVVRRILGNLRAAKLVASQPGTGGGWRLIREPASITLCEVYRAVEGEPLFALHERAPSTDCPVGRHIQPALSYVFDQATAAMEHKLRAISLADIVQRVVVDTHLETIGDT